MDEAAANAGSGQSNSITLSSSGITAGSPGHPGAVADLDSNKILSELQAQSASMAHLKTRMDEVVAEVRRETTILWQELNDHRERVDKASERQEACFARVDRLDRGLAEESEARIDAEHANHANFLDLRSFISLESQRCRELSAEVRRALRTAGRSHRGAEGFEPDGVSISKKALAALPEGAEAEGDGAYEAATNGVPEELDAPVGTDEGLTNYTDEIVYGEGFLAPNMASLSQDEEMYREVLDRMEARLNDSVQDNAAQLTELDQRIREEWTGLRGWVDAAVVAVVNRISSLELSLQTEMADRTKSLDDIMDGVSKVGKLQEQVETLAEEVRQTQEQTQALQSQSATTSRLRACRLSSSAVTASSTPVTDEGRQLATRSDVSIRMDSAPSIDILTNNAGTPSRGQNTTAMAQGAGPLWPAGMRIGSSLQVPSATAGAALSTPRERESSAPPRTSVVRSMAPASPGTVTAVTTATATPQAVTAPVPRPDRSAALTSSSPQAPPGSQTVPAASVASAATTTSAHGTLAGREALFPTISPPSGQVMRQGRRA